MKNIILIMSIALVALSCSTKSPWTGKKALLKNSIDQFFIAMKNNDTIVLNQLMTEEVQFKSVTYLGENKSKINIANRKEFYQILHRMKKEKINWDEIHIINDIQQDNVLAIAWIPYMFEINEKIDHCGTNVFQFIKENKVFKIHSIYDSKRNCEVNGNL